MASSLPVRSVTSSFNSSTTGHGPKSKSPTLKPARSGSAKSRRLLLSRGQRLQERKLDRRPTQLVPQPGVEDLLPQPVLDRLVQDRGQEFFHLEDQVPL